MSLTPFQVNMISLLFMLFLILFIYLKDKDKFEKEGIFLLRRTEKGIEWINTFANKYKKLCEMFGYFSISFSLGFFSSFFVYNDKKNWIIYSLTSFVMMFMAFKEFSSMTFSSYIYLIVWCLFGLVGQSFFYLVKKAYEIIHPVGKIVPALQLVLPFEAKKAPIFYVPLPYWIISIAIILIVHEFAHAIVARARGVSIKSVGYGFLLFLPLGFAEPDEEELKKKSKETKMMVYGAGSLSNIMFAVIFFALFLGSSLLIAKMYVPVGVQYEKTINGTYAFKNLPPSGVITQINGKQINNLNDLIKVMKNLKPGENITIFVNSKKYWVILVHNPENKSLPLIGIYGISTKFSVKKSIKKVLGIKIPEFFIYIANLFKFLFIINLGVGFANLLPLLPFDGGLILKDLLDIEIDNMLRKKRIKGLLKSFRILSFLAIQIIVVLLILINFLGPYIK